MGLADQPDTLARWMADIERRLRVAETAARAAHTSITDADGKEVVRMDRTGLAMLEPSGLQRVKVGRQPDGSYGAWIDGGPVRALDHASGTAVVVNASLTTAEQFFSTVTLAVPAWAVVARVEAALVFQLSNGSGALQRMEFRADINGQPGFGAWSHDVAAGFVANTTDLAFREITGPELGSTITVRAMCKVGSGTNAANGIRVRATALFFR